MRLFRNKEVKKVFIVSVALTVLLTLAGLLIDIKSAALVFVACAVISGVWLYNIHKRYNLLAEYADELSRVLYGLDNIDLDEYSEGELSILNTEVKKLLRKLRDDAQLLKKEKEFLADSIADLSHQLKTPLTSIGIIVDLLKEEDLTVEHRFKLVSQLQGALNRTTWQIDALLKISKLDADMVQFQKEKFTVDDLVRRSIEPIEILMELRGIQLKISGSNSASIVGDLKWSCEAICNIIKNSSEHCKDGGVIEIIYSENSIYTEIEIVDNGKGIDDADLPHLFERFYQGKNASDNSYGIGLALAKMIITRQNGTIKAQNRKDTKGARFIIRYYKGVV